jgi:hypothetical protein
MCGHGDLKNDVADDFETKLNNLTRIFEIGA